MFKKIFITFAVLVAALAFLSGCGMKSEQTKAAAPEKMKITDMAGREVEVPVPAQKVVAIGPGALRLLCYVNGADKIAGVEEIEMKQPTGRPYILAYPELKQLPVIGTGGPDSSPDAEKLVSVKPDVIFAASLLEKASADELQSKTNIPVVVLSYGKTTTFDDEVYKSISLIGQITGNEERSARVVDYFKKCIDDLNSRTKEIPDSKKPGVYVGALGMKGTHGIESTQAQYPPFRSINARNIVNETGKAGSIMIDREKLLNWNPDIVFIDEGGYELVRNDYNNNPQFYQSLNAFKKGEVYGQIPFNYYSTNLDTAIADAYYAGKVIFPDKFKDIDPVRKADEIYEFLLGKPLYDQMAKDFGGFKKLNFSAQ
ncbi:MAG: iron ABC transporter substrate-binding protein [Bacillota bacterium]